MIRSAGLLVLLLFAASQDPADKVKALVDKLGSDEIAVRDEAARELVKLGPAALPALREFLTKADGERKPRLKRVISRIEREDRIAKARAPAPRVTLKAKGRPAAEVFGQIEKQTGVRIDTSEIPAETTVDADLAGVSVWDAIEAVCKAHGKIMFAFSPNRVVIEAAAFRTLPRATSDTFFVFMDHFFVSSYGGGGNPHFTARPGLAWPPGRAPLAYRFESDSLVDDAGTAYSQGAKPGAVIWAGGPAVAGISGATIYHGFSESVPEAARAIAEWKGRMILYVPAGLDRDASIEKPVGKFGAFNEGEESKIAVSSSRRNAGNIHFELQLSLSPHLEPEAGQSEIRAPAIIVLRDSTGTLHWGEADITPQRGGVRRSGDWVTRPLSVEFEVPEKAEIESLDVMIPVDLQEVVVPFEFRDIRFRTWK